MNQLKLINSDTLKQISDYLDLPDPPGLILEGIPGLGKSLAGKYIASKILKCNEDELATNPDFYETNNTGSLRVEDIDDLLDYSQRCSVKTKKVFIIHNAHSITPATQNRLLKLLEDRGSSNILIFLSAENRIIGTIKSRCYTISFHPLNEKEMKDFLGKQHVAAEYHDFLCYLLDNAPYSFSNNQSEIEDYISQLNKIYGLTIREDIFIIFHTLKEKDDKEFYPAHSNTPEWNIRLLLYPFYRYILDSVKSNNQVKYAYPDKMYSLQESMHILEYGMDHLKMLHTAYTKNDYFNLLRYIVQVN